MSGRTPARSLLGLALLVLAVGGTHRWWVQHQQHSLGSQLAALASPGDIQMLASDTCGPCMAARLWMKQNDVPFSECSIERDTTCQQQFQAAGAPGTPVLVVRGQHQLGFSPQRVLQRLQQQAG
jgi:glutaredoxin